jgi:hypothetical protein
MAQSIKQLKECPNFRHLSRLVICAQDIYMKLSVFFDIEMKISPMPSVDK